MNRPIRNAAVALGFAWHLLLQGVLPASAVDVPKLLNYQGHLTDPGGGPKNGTFGMSFKFYDAASGGNQLPTSAPWSESQSVTVTAGEFHVLLGSESPLPANPFAGAQTDSAGPVVYLQVSVNGEALQPRSRIVSAAFSVGTEEPTYGNDEIMVYGLAGFGSTNTNVPRWNTILKNTGTAMTLTQSATNGDSITINKSGLYSVSVQAKAYNATSAGLGATVNSPNLTSECENPNNVQYALFWTLDAVASTAYSVISASRILRLNAGDVVRGCAVASTNLNSFENSSSSNNLRIVLIGP